MNKIELEVVILIVSTVKLQLMGIVRLEVAY